jgi:hypothetical protein
LAERYEVQICTETVLVTRPKTLKRGGAKIKRYLLARWVRPYGDRRVDTIGEADVLKFKNDLL